MTSRHAQGRWEVGAGIALDLCEGCYLPDPKDRDLAKRRLISDGPALILGLATSSAHHAGREHEKQYIARIAFFCNLYQGQGKKGR